MNVNIKKTGAIALSLIIAAFAVWGGIVASRGGADPVFYEGNDSSLPTLDVYTSGGATTPQLAFFASIREGELGRLFNFRIHLWKNPDDLLANVLAGKGDLWIGHTEGFAVANLRGAPVRMLVFTSFHKFYIITSGDAVKWEDLAGERVACAPPGSPAVALLQRVMDKSPVKIILEPYQGRELELLLSSGKVKSAVLPEPLVSLMLSKNSKLRVIANVENLFSSVTGMRGPLPVAGIAVNGNTARRYPGKMASLQKIILGRSEILSREGKKAAGYFPGYFNEYISTSIVEQSLVRDTISSKKGTDLQVELEGYLNAVHPGLFKDKNISEWSGSFLWR